MSKLEMCGDCGRVVVVSPPAAPEAGDAPAPFARYRRRSKIQRDSEIEAFILECSKTMVVREIVAACLARFGPERAPSQAAIYRYMASASKTG